MCWVLLCVWRRERWESFKLIIADLAVGHMKTIPKRENCWFIHSIVIRLKHWVAYLFLGFFFSVLAPRIWIASTHPQSTRKQLDSHILQTALHNAREKRKYNCVEWIVWQELREGGKGINYFAFLLQLPPFYVCRSAIKTKASTYYSKRE